MLIICNCKELFMGWLKGKKAFRNLNLETVIRAATINRFMSLKIKASIGPPGIYNLYVLGYPKISKYIHNDIVWASQLLKEVDSICKKGNKDLGKSCQSNSFSIDKKHIKHRKKKHTKDESSDCNKTSSSYPEERSSSSDVQLCPKDCTRKTKSTGSIEASVNTSKITDAAGARDIIVKCITDLNKVKSYFEIRNVEVGVSAEVQMKPCPSSKKSVREEDNYTSSGPRSKQSKVSEFDIQKCCCSETGAIELPVEELLDVHLLTRHTG
ncbi:hypothetical protein NQ317_018427, partial [Molorchus minor]